MRNRSNLKYPYIQIAINTIDQINDIVGRVIAWLSLVMVVMTCAVVIARYVFNVGSISLQESIMYMHGAVFMLAIGFTLKEHGHVRVDVFYEKFSPETKITINIAGHLLFLLPFCVFVLWTSIDYVSFAWSLKESSAQPGGLPGVYLLKSLIPAMAILLMLQGVGGILKDVLALTNPHGK